eukprot:2574994-Amphidinium_carterae.1
MACLCRQLLTVIHSLCLSASTHNGAHVSTDTCHTKDSLSTPSITNLDAKTRPTVTNLCRSRWPLLRWHRGMLAHNLLHPEHQYKHPSLTTLLCN